MENIVEKTIDERIEDVSIELMCYKEDKRYDEMTKSLILLVSLYEKNFDFESIVNTIVDYYDYITSDQLKLLDKLGNAYFKLERYNDFLDCLTKKESFNLELKDLANVKIYKSICYEALDEIELSIKSLESIDDNISKYTLVNKYLKLALLYIKSRRIDNAKDAYNNALMFDRNKTNDMFLLVESDLLYENKDYYGSLDAFQSFFIKSRNKYKYLDRYIKINIKLNKLDDAYNFYKKYQSSTSLSIPKQGQIQLLIAGKELLKLMNKFDEINEANSRLESLKPSFFKGSADNANELVLSITSFMSLPLTKYDKYKNLANKFFKLLNGINKNTLVFVEKCPDGYLYSKFNNTQLKEKLITYSSLRENGLFDFFNKEHDEQLEYFYNDKLEKVNETVKFYTLKNNLCDYGYFIVSNNQEYDIVYSILRDALIEVFNRLDVITKSSENSNALIKTIESLNTGFIKMYNDQVEFVDSYSRNLFNAKNNIISYFEFREKLENPNIYPNDFLINKEQIIKLHLLENTKVIKFVSSLIDNVIYSLVIDVTETLPLDETKDYFYYHSGLYFNNENALNDFVDKNEESYSIIGLYIPIVEESDSIDKRVNKLNALYNYMHSVSESSILYYLGENHFLYLSFNIDKRILDGIINRTIDGIKQLYKYSYSLREKRIVGFLSKSLKNRTYFQVRELIEYGFYYSIEKQEILVLDNEEKRDYALYKTYETTVSKYIKDDSLDIEFYPIVNEEKNQIHYFLVKPIVPFDLNYSMLEKIAAKNSLETKLDSNIIYKIFDEAKDLCKHLRFIIPIHKESITNQNFIKKLSIAFKQTDLKNRIIFETDTLDFTEYKKGLDSLHNAGFKLATTYSDLSVVKDLSMIDIVFMDIKNNSNFVKHITEGVRSILKKEVVVINGEHQTNTLSLNEKYKVYSLEKIRSIK